MSNGFVLHLPSNTKIEGNHANKFKIRLPKKLEFNSQWELGMLTMRYPHTWYSSLSLAQEHFEIYWQNGKNTSVNLRQVNLATPEELLQVLTGYLSDFSRQQRKLLQKFKENNPPFQDLNVQEKFTYNWLQNSSNTFNIVKFQYVFNRFLLEIDTKFVRVIEFSPQLSHCLGFENFKITQSSYKASFLPNLTDSVSTLFVYLPELIQPVIIGDRSAELLQIVTVTGVPGQSIEAQYQLIQYHKILVKEISEINVEIRTSSGKLVPFLHGSTLISIHFRKSPIF